MTIGQVKSFWDNEPCGTAHAVSDVGSIKYFDEIEQQRYSAEPFIHSFAQFTRWRGMRVLEVGCGCGTDLLQFARAGADVCAIDLSSKSASLAKQRLALYGFTANIIEANAENLPFQSNYFDLVYSWGVLHHTPNPDIAVGEISRVLKSGGQLRAMLYNRHSWIGLKIRIRHGMFKPLVRTFADYMESPGTKAYTVKELQQLFSQFSDVAVNPVLTRYDTARMGKLLPLVRLIGDRMGFFTLVSGTK